MRHGFHKFRRAWAKFPSLVKWYTLIQAARFLALFRDQNACISAWPETPVVLTSKIAVFMHYNRAGRVSGPSMSYIKGLIANGRCVVFVTNSGQLTAIAEARLRELCVAIYIRRNSGYDFGAWRDVIDTLELPAANTEELIIVNDSMYGPLCPLDGTLARLNYEQADIWGLTESWQQRYHLQSYFLAFGPKALRAPVFKEFWGNVKPVPSKTYIVRAYEVGLTQVMMRAGLRCAALWRYESLVLMVNRAELVELFDMEDMKPGHNDPIQIARKHQMIRIRGAAAGRIAMNPTADLWRQLLLSGFPFIKRELLHINPSQVEDVGSWVEVLRSLQGMEPDLVLAELRLALKGTAP